MLRGHGPAVTASGECTRILYAGRTEHLVQQAWAPHERGIRLLTTLVDSRAKRGVGAKNAGYCEANETALSELARKNADAIMVGKREAARRKGVPQAGGGVGADRDMCCPVIAAIKASHEGSRTRTTANSTAKPAASPEVNYVCLFIRCPAAAAAAVAAAASGDVPCIGVV